jgi:Cof subfamily protein (haloacid dehalogenase superfamily)
LSRAGGPAAERTGRPSLLDLPAEFPDEVEVFACDLDRTLIAEDVTFGRRTLAALAAAQAAGIRVLLVTGRMFRSVRPYAEVAGIRDPIVCYQGAAVVDLESGRFLRHEPVPLDAARRVIAAVQELGYTLNAYVGDELYVAKVTDEAREYASFQQLPIHEVGDLLSWLSEPPTKLVTVGACEDMSRLKLTMVERFGDTLHISKSLPIFLEFSRLGVTKGSGLAWLADRLGFDRERTVAFGDGENDVEMLEWAGFGVAVANADSSAVAAADFICPPAVEEGVAQVIEAYLGARGLLPGGTAAS